MKQDTNLHIDGIGIGKVEAALDEQRQGKETWLAPFYLTAILIEAWHKHHRIEAKLNAKYESKESPCDTFAEYLDLRYPSLTSRQRTKHMRLAGVIAKHLSPIAGSPANRIATKKGE